MDVFDAASDRFVYNSFDVVASETILVKDMYRIMRGTIQGTYQ